jgi:hypothetical protein
MVNVYVFRADATTPEGWTEIAAGYRNRLILSGGTMLETGGADTHNHTVSISSVSSVSDYNFAMWYDSSQHHVNQYGGSHTHSATSSGSNPDNSLPSYKNFRVVYRSTTGWNGTLPAGSIVFRENVPDGYSRVDAGQSYFIRTASATGGTGGADTHSHWVYSALAAFSVTSVKCRSNYSTGQYATPCTHTHASAGAAASSDTFNYKYWGCGLVSADGNTIVRADSYLLFDDTPDTNYWEVVSADGCYLKALGTYTPATGGTNTIRSHTHSFSFNSQSSSSPQNTGYASSYPSFYASHTHTITGSLNSANCQPSYVRLIVARAKIDFVTTLTVTYDFDTLVKKLDIESSFDSDFLLKSIDLPSSIDVDLALKRFDIDAAWSMSVNLIPAGYDLEYVVDLLLKRFGIDVSAAFDLLQKKEGSWSFEEDVLLKKLDLDASLNQDVFVQGIFDEEYSIGQFLKKTFSATSQMDFYAKGETNAAYRMNLSTIKALRLSYLVEFLMFGPAEITVRADVILSGKPTKHWPHRRYPTPVDVPVGVREVHGESFDPDYHRQARTYPNVEPSPSEPVIHSERFDHQPLERKNRQTKITYR